MSSLVSLTLRLSHNLNTPLGSSLTAISFLKDNLERSGADQKLIDCCNMALEGTNQAVKIVQQLSTVSNAQALPTPVMFNLSAVIGEYISQSWSSDSTRQILTVVNSQFQKILAGEFNGSIEDSLIFQVEGDEIHARLGSGSQAQKWTDSLMGPDNNDLKTLLEKSRNGENILYESPYLICSLNTRQDDGLYILARVEKEPDKTDYMILSAFMMNVSLAIDYHILSASKTRSQKNMLYFLSEVIEQHFSETGNHIRRVSEMVYLLARKLGVHEDLAENWKMASILHDLGKIGIPDHILKKPGKLTEDEMEIVKSHVLIGHRMLSSNEDEFFPDAAAIALSHHECWNGSGYPYGLKGEEIPLHARILSVVDVFDALTHKRIYKDSWNPKDLNGLFCRTG